MRRLSIATKLLANRSERGRERERERVEKPIRWKRREHLIETLPSRVPLLLLLIMISQFCD